MALSGGSSSTQSGVTIDAIGAGLNFGADGTGIWSVWPPRDEAPPRAPWGPQGDCETDMHGMDADTAWMA